MFRVHIKSQRNLPCCSPSSVCKGIVANDPMSQVFKHETCRYIFFACAWLLRTQKKKKNSDSVGHCSLVYHKLAFPDATPKAAALQHHENLLPLSPRTLERGQVCVTTELNYLYPHQLSQYNLVHCRSIPHRHKQ